MATSAMVNERLLARSSATSSEFWKEGKAVVGVLLVVFCEWVVVVAVGHDGVVLFSAISGSDYAGEVKLRADLSFVHYVRTRL